MLETGIPEFPEHRIDIEAAEYPSQEGRISGRMIVYGDLPHGAESLPLGGRLRWNSAVDMRIGDDRENPTKKQQRRQRSPVDLKRKLRSIPRHRRQEWKTTLYREAHDVDKRTIPALKRYGRDLMAKVITRWGI